MSSAAEEASLSMNLTNIVQSFRYWPRVFRLLWQIHKPYFLFILFFNILRGVSPVISLLLLTTLIDSIGASWDTGFQTVLWPFIWLFAFTALNEALSLVQNYVSKIFETLLSNRITILIMEKSISLSLSDFENSQVQDALKRAQNEAGHRPYQILQQILSIISATITLFSIAAVLISWKWWAAFLLIFFPLTSFYSFLKIGQQEFMIQWNRAPKMRTTWYLSVLLTRDISFKEIKVFQLGGYLLGKYNELLLQFLAEDKRMIKKRLGAGAIFQAAQEGVNASMFLMVLWSAFKREISIGQVVSYTQAITLTLVSSQNLTQGILSLCQHNLFLQQLFTFLDLQSSDPSARKIDASEASRPANAPAIQSVEFRNVSFRYPGNSYPALRNVSFTLRRGETLAIVGRNGSGKSTLMKLLTQLYDSFEGDILINGVSIRDMDCEVFRRKVGVVFQDFVHYEMQVKQNIGFGNVAKMEEDAELWKAADRAGIASLIQSMPEGLATQLGRLFDEGHQLSGGQWQRVAIARAFMREAELYVLDEPSSMLDPETELQVFQAFRELVRDRLGIFISHRYSAIRYADHILMMDQGSVVEQGNHQQLMQLNGMYAELYMMQANAYLDADQERKARSAV
ncbi:ABC transporter ATP-binding protein/permease [Paenibacillus sp. MZ04-78.2]|uniref:ABC transporter ATP-binding protein n=1 Tax=Paenibacillus sp. MZ04-78.2 TaxID=2962034 RepID=UPI0020B65C17|nr:ABC transporter ATP-binding protein [Paenibacillus sp. MZ04-78.2]MCP3773734.1 ABC transporter ATP-binding protein/permease [Paenibacillus sp. MZ04-78.2]